VDTLKDLTMDKKQPPVQVVPKDAIVLMQSDIAQLSVTNRVHLQTVMIAVEKMQDKRDAAAAAANAEEPA
jgi:hypothetical protein